MKPAERLFDMWAFTLDEVLSSNGRKIKVIPAEEWDNASASRRLRKEVLGELAELVPHLEESDFSPALSVRRKGYSIAAVLLEGANQDGSLNGAIFVRDGTGKLVAGAYKGNVYVLPSHRDLGIGREIIRVSFETGMTTPWSSPSSLPELALEVRKSAHRWAVRHASDRGYEIEPDVLEDYQESKIKPISTGPGKGDVLESYFSYPAGPKLLPLSMRMSDLTLREVTQPGGNPPRVVSAKVIKSQQLDVMAEDAFTSLSQRFPVLDRSDFAPTRSIPNALFAAYSNGHIYICSTDFKLIGGQKGGNSYVPPEYRGRGIGREIALVSFETGLTRHQDGSRFFSIAGLSSRKSAHRWAVENALKEGIPVRPEVLYDYPDLNPFLPKL
jgi:GNAT superfamily N-acetyltransferase